MPYSSGTYTFPSNSFAQPVTGTIISSTAATATWSDLATALSTCVLKDGSQTITANVPFSNFRLTGVGAATARTDAIQFAQVQDGVPTYLTSVAGTANAITATAPNSMTAYATGQRFTFIPASTNTSATTIIINGISGAKNIFANGVACVGGEIIANLPTVIMYDGTQFNIDSSAAMPTLVDPFVCDGRLTLTSGTPVTTGDVTAAGTLYFTPYKGNRVALYTGTAWKLYKFSEVSLALTLTSGKPYDIWLYDNSGTLTLESLVWTDDTNRATALTRQDGVYVKTGSLVRRYLGTIYSSGANTTEDSFAKRYVWNYYNRVRRPMKVVDTTNSWNYTTLTYQQANANAANQLDMVIGVSEDVVSAASYGAAANGTVPCDLGVGIGVDSTSTNSAQILHYTVQQVANRAVPVSAHYKGFPGIGRHFLPWLEISAATGTTTWLGDGNVTYIQSGIEGEIPA